MKFPWSYRELNKVFLNARTPDMGELRGEYIVDILSFLPSLKFLTHTKVIYEKDNKVQGHNVLFGRPWGRFAVSESIIRDIGTIHALMLNYNEEDNFLLLKGIRDYIRCINKNSLYIGKFYYVISGLPCFIGFFSLKKIK